MNFFLQVLAHFKGDSAILLIIASMFTGNFIYNANTFAASEDLQLVAVKQDIYSREKTIEDNNREAWALEYKEEQGTLTEFENKRLKVIEAENELKLRELEIYYKKLEKHEN